MIEFKIDIKFSIYVIVAFIAFTVIGTLTHELGHIAVAKSLGYDTKLHYGSMNHFPKGYNDDEDVIKANDIFNEIENKTIDVDNFFKGEKLDELKKLRYIIDEKYSNNETHIFYVILGGPIHTILTSFVGLFILWFRKSKDKFDFKLYDWIGVFLSLFILREVFNFITTSYKYLFYNGSNFHGDEFRISLYLGLNEWLIPSITLTVGLLISLYVIFKLIPIRFRLSFIVSGLIGGVLGFYLWFGVLGGLLLP